MSVIDDNSTISVIYKMLCLLYKDYLSQQTNKSVSSIDLTRTKLEQLKLAINKGWPLWSVMSSIGFFVNLLSKLNTFCSLLQSDGCVATPTVASTASPSFSRATRTWSGGVPCPSTLPKSPATPCSRDRWWGSKLPTPRAPGWWQQRSTATPLSRRKTSKRRNSDKSSKLSLQPGHTPHQV